MNVHFTISAIIIIFIFALSWFLYRFYKRIGRRCRKKDCGRTGVKRVCKILLPPDETVSSRSPQGRRRWFIRRPIKLTFAVCKCGWVELVKIDTDPVSLWHAFWVRWFHREQYCLEGWPLIEATERKLRKLYLSGGGRRSVGKEEHLTLDPQASDTPPVSLLSLFRDYFEELTDELAEIIGDEEKK